MSRNGQLPDEQWTIGIASSRDYFAVKGIVESLITAVRGNVDLEISQIDQGLLEASRSAELRVDGRLFGYLGEVADAGLQQFGLRSPATVAGLSVRVLVERANMVPQYTRPSPYPPVVRDLNLIVDESLRWSDLSHTVRESAGDCLEKLSYQETYRDANKEWARQEASALLL